MIPVRKRVKINSIHPQWLVLHPGKSHKILLKGDFTYLVEASSKNSSGPVWGRLSNGSLNHIFFVEEVRSDILIFTIPGASLAAGTERFVEIGDIPLDQNEPRSLVTSSESITLATWLPIDDI
jgi:hypothetical protein